MTIRGVIHTNVDKAVDNYVDKSVNNCGMLHGAGCLGERKTGILEQKRLKKICCTKSAKMRGK